MADNGKRYFREINPGDRTIEGRDANGLTLNSNGNAFLYSGNNQDEINLLQQQQYNGNINIDPNKIASYVAVIKAGTVDVNLGSENRETLNINNNPSNTANVITPVPQATPASSLPAQEPIPSPSPSPSPTPPVVVEEENLTEFKYDETPIEEGIPLYDIIQVKDNIQDGVLTVESPSLVSIASARNAIRNNGGRVPKEGVDFEKYGSSFKIIQNNEATYGALGNQHYYPCALYNQGDPQWGSNFGGGYTLKAAGCCYTSFSMIVTNRKNNAGYTPQWFWDNVKKSTVVYWSVMGDAVGLSGNLVSTTSTSKVDEVLKTGPLMFEWDNTNRASKTSYAGIYTKRHHWMVINGRNTDGTYTIFDPAGGKIRKNQTKAQIEAGLIRIFYF